VIGFWVIGVVIVAGGGGLWWLRRRGSRRIEMNTDYQRTKGQAYLQAQHTRNNIGDPFH
jgi:hypothetical protein